ncbi:MAG: 1,4-alpha-glucan branching protein GlgB [Nitrospinae bacterium]|nr:1,4-alpha-glucan branching protein GlgB [Nitrospinota bacterium]
MEPTISKTDINKIRNSEHHNPFEVLGAHKVSIKEKKGIVIRTFQPEAKKVEIIEIKKRSNGGKPRIGPQLHVPISSKVKGYPMQGIDHNGIFEAIFLGREEIFMYKFRVTFNKKNVQVMYDPFSFKPILTDYDLHLFAEGNHHNIYDKLGAHIMTIDGIEGVYFAIWAPNAKRVSVVGDFNNWDGRRHPMRLLGGSGVWEIFIPELKEGDIYKYEIKAKNNHIYIKSDPYAYYSEIRPKTASLVYNIDKYKYKWGDALWMQERENKNPLELPISIYEVHLNSWKRVPEEGNRGLTYREMALDLIKYVKEMGFTHIELLPIVEHPLDDSWGYQVTGYYSPTSRYGTPEDFMYFVDQCHQNNIGVILDWVPAHFPKDAHGLSWFDGTSLYEYGDQKKREHKDWGTLVFNYARKEVGNFLIANGLFWLKKYHIDGLRVDAVASMLYLNYSRKDGEWVANEYGGRENLEAINLLRRFNILIYKYFPGILTIAEESTAWPLVSKPTYLGGLGFGLKWNMGWMHDVLEYMSKDSIYRRYHHNDITFPLLYAFNENFVLPLSHDEVVHQKGSLLAKMPGNEWEKFANLRLLYGFMYGHPGKKLLFMGGEFGQWREWDHKNSLDWHLLEYQPHQKLQTFLKDLNRVHKSEPSLYEIDFHHSGFEWIDCHDCDNSVLAFARKGKDQKNMLIFICNFTPICRYNYRLAVPNSSIYKEILNSNAEIYGGNNIGNPGMFKPEPVPHYGKPFSIILTLPPLSVLILKPITTMD